jgi:hypothetical protein
MWGFCEKADRPAGLLPIGKRPREVSASNRGQTTISSKLWSVPDFGPRSRDDKGCTAPRFQDIIAG